MTTLLPNISPISKPTKASLIDSSAKKLGAKTSEVSRILETQGSSPKLSIPDLFFGDEGAYEIAKYLKDHNDFTSIELRGNNISASGFEAICDNLKDAKSLKKISAEWNNIGSDNLGLISLHELLQESRTIVTVDLRNNHIGPQCAGTLSNIIRDASSLKTLDLRWNELGDEGASLILLALKDTANKIQIDLTGNKVSQEILLEISSLTNERPTFSERPSTKFEMSYQQTNRKDSYKTSHIGHTERTTHTPDRLSYNKENFQSENLPTQASQQFKHERYPSVDRVLKPSMAVNATTPLSKSNILRAQVPGSVTPMQVAGPRLDFEQSILSSNRIQTATPSILRKSYAGAGIPQFEPLMKKPAPPVVVYNPEADLQEIQARYEQEAREVQDKYQSHMQAHLRMTKVINDLERYLEEEKGRANKAEARIQELCGELDAESKVRQELELNCSHLVAEVQNRDLQIQELSVHLDQSGRENADLKAMIEALKQENLAITQEFNIKLQESEGRFTHDFADLTAIYNGKIQDAEAQFNKEIADLTGQNHALKVEIDRMQAEFQHQMHHMHTESETRLREYEGKLREYEGKFNNATLASGELAEELKKQENYIQVLQAQHEEHLKQALMFVREEEYQKTQKIVADIEKELRAVHAEYERVNAINKEITLDVQNYELQRRQQQSQYEGEISQLRAENDQLRSDLRIIASNFEKSKDEVALKNSMVSRMEGDIENLRSEVTRTKDNYVDQIERLKRDFEFERKKSENTERDSRRKIMDLERELKESKEEITRVTREHDRLGDMLKGNISKLISQTFSGKSSASPDKL